MKLSGVVVRVPAKVNLQLSVGPLGADGFHEVTTVFQAISLYDDVTVKFGEPGTGIVLTLSGPTSAGVPVDSTNLAYMAAQLMIDKHDLDSDLSIHIKKEIPVAGGMAGGSADAAGVIVAMDSSLFLGIQCATTRANGIFAKENVQPVFAPQDFSRKPCLLPLTG